MRILISRQNRRSQSGLTLLELLIALGIFSIVSVMAYSGLQSIIIDDERIEYHSKQLISLQRVFMTLGQDISLLTGRTIRDRYGDIQPAFVASELGEYRIEFTKSSWFNPANLPRSDLQRIAYALSDNKLIRYNWITLDQAQDSQPFATTLIENVDGISIRMMDEAKQWHDHWPPIGVTTVSQPAGVEITLSINQLGDIRRLYRTTEYQW